MNKLIKKIIPYILVLIIFVGLFSPILGIKKTQAATGRCYDMGDPKNPKDLGAGITQAQCNPTDQKPRTKLEWRGTPPPGTPGTDTPPEKSEPSEFERVLTDDCNIYSGSGVMGCVLVVLYYTYFQIPALILALSASFFNSVVSISLDSALTSSSTFIPAAWVVVRDLSNIFFILVLLYISIQTILGIGGHDGPKKMVAQVIIMALLINFSMFFTKIVIDSANILALVFFEKINVESKVTGESKPREYEQSRPGEKDISGGIVQAFNPTELVSKEFLDKTKTFAGDKEVDVASKPVPFSIKLGMIIVSGTIMLFAAYAFFIAGISFLGRLIELWILIIFSPFAFMSSIIPILSHIEGIGWESWLKKLLATSFMAPIFMFFIYLIFKLLKANIFSSFVSGAGFMANFLGILLPALILLALLLKATEFAKKGGGKFGEMALGAIKMAGGLALGAATGGAALLGTGLIGGAGGALVNKAAKFAEDKGFGRVGGRLRDVSDFARKSSFDVRGVKIGGKTLASATGMNLGEAGKGGWSEMKKQQVEKRQKRADVLEKRGTGKEKKAVDDAEIDLKEAVLTKVTALNSDGNPVELPIKLHLENMDKEIEKARLDLNDVKGTGDAGATTAALATLKAKQQKKDDLRSNPITRPDGSISPSIKNLEKTKNEAKASLDVASDKITTDYAKAISGGLSKSLNMIFRAGAYSLAGADEAARKIRTGTKLDSGEKPK